MSLGFDLVGIASADFPTQAADNYIRWLNSGYHAGMDWLARDVERRIDPHKVLPGCHSIIVLGVNYFRKSEITPEHGNATGRIARYARIEDYHRTVGKAVQKLVRLLEVEFDLSNEYKFYVDTCPVMEMVWAVEAGLGFIGKNCCLVHPRRGSWFFLAVVLTTLELAADSPVNVSCGTCRRCLDACPTGALVEPGLLDSNLCLSYLTIEHKGEINADIASKLSDRLFGCDICQEVCPFNTRFQHTADSRSIIGAPIHPDTIPLEDIIDLRDQQEFMAYFGRHSSIRRAGLDVIKRTARLLRQE